MAVRGGVRYELLIMRFQHGGCAFAFYNAPKPDKYLKSKYGEGYEEYEKKKKCSFRSFTERPKTMER